jgi:hypothetical protein
MQISKLKGYHGEIVNLKWEYPRRDVKEYSNDLDLVKMSHWALHHLINNPIKELEYACRFSIWPLNCPPRPPSIEGPDPIAIGDTDSRMDYAWIYMREMSGLQVGREVQDGVRRRILSYIGEDGFSWVKLNHYMESNDPNIPYGISTWATMKAILSLSETYAQTEDINIRRIARKAFEALLSLASWDTGRAWYKGGGGPIVNGEWYPTGQTYSYPAIIAHILRYWEVTRDEEAFDFACALADGMLAGLQENIPENNKIQEDGSFKGHTHTTLHAVWGIAYLGAITRNPRYIEYARRVYEYVLNCGTDYGWFPCAMWDNTVRGVSETCAVADMITIGTWLAKAGYPEYWDNVERAVRNYLRYAQFFITTPYKELYLELNQNCSSEEIKDSLDTLQSLQGGFLCCTKPNDIIVLPYYEDRRGMFMAGCCIAEGMRALYTVWKNIVTLGERGEVFINMALNRNAKEATVISHYPDEGGLSVIAKKQGTFFIRPPVWTPRREVVTLYNNQEITPKWRGDYVEFSNVTSGDMLTVKYLLPSFTQKIQINDQEYKVIWKGNTVVEVESLTPPRLPLFSKEDIPLDSPYGGYEG